MEIYKVYLGSGMGIECSGDCVDITFYELAEKSFVLSPDVIALYDVQSMHDSVMASYVFKVVTIGPGLTLFAN
jgi:hypothetical protein